MSTSRVERPFSVYLDSERARWLDSMEGVPDYVPAKPAAAAAPFGAAWRNGLYRWLDLLGGVAPGLALAAVLAWIGALAAGWLGESVLGFDQSPLSPILMTVLLGLLVRNVAGLPRAYESGLRMCVKRLLRIGVALLGLRLSLVEIAQTGLSALPVVVCCIVAALLITPWLSRWVGLSTRLGSLVAVGTGICGVSAIVATAPAIDAEEDEVSYAVAAITLFGMLGLFVYPFVSHWLFAGDAGQAGMFLGTAIHDTSQVAGAGLMYQMHYGAPEALDAAATTKLLRNLFMGAVIPLMAVLYHRRGHAGVKKGQVLGVAQWIPLFVVGFVAMACIRTVGDMGERPFGILAPDAWAAVLSSAGTVSVFCLSIAMAAVGLGTSALQLKILGWKPLAVGFTAAFLVGGVSLVLIKLTAMVGL